MGCSLCADPTGMSLGRLSMLGYNWGCAHPCWGCFLLDLSIPSLRVAGHGAPFSRSEACGDARGFSNIGAVLRRLRGRRFVLAIYRASDYQMDQAAIGFRGSRVGA